MVKYFSRVKIVKYPALTALTAFTLLKTQKNQGTWLFFTCPRPALNSTFYTFFLPYPALDIKKSA